MHIRSFIGAALLCLGMLAIAPVAMADPAPDICSFDLSISSSVHVDNAIGAVPACKASALIPTMIAALSFGAFGQHHSSFCESTQPRPLDFAARRLHFDPGRCLA